MTLDPDIFEDGLDVGDWIVKAHPKVPLRKFSQEVPQDIVDAMEAKYSKRLGTLMEDVEKRLDFVSFNKSARLVIYPGGDDIRKAIKTPSLKKREPVLKPGSRGGKFYRDDKGKVHYGDRPSPGHTEMSDKDIANHAKKFVTPTVFVGHNEESTKAILDSGYFKPHELAVIEWFRESVLKSPETLKRLEGYKDVEDINAVDFTWGKKKGAEALVLFLKDAFDEIDIEGPDGPLDSDQKTDLWEGVLKSYDKAHKDPDVLDAIKQNLARHIENANDASKHIKDSKGMTAGSGIFDRMLSPTNLHESGLETMALLRDSNLLFTPTKGQEIGKDEDGKSIMRLKGQMHINDMIVTAAHKGDINIVESCSPAQAIAFAIAGTMSLERDPEAKGAYHEFTFKNTDGTFKTKFSDLSFGNELKTVLAANHKGKINEALEKHFVERISELGDHILTELNSQHKGGRRDLETIMTGNTKDLLTKKDAIKEIRAKIEEGADTRDKILKSKDNDKLELPKGNMQKGIYSKDRNLFPHQKQAVNWMEEAKRGILGHGPGLGKTTAAVTFIEHMKGKGDPDVQRGVMFLPPALIPQWINEIQSYAPGSKILNLSSFASEDRADIAKELGPKSDYILTSKGLLTGQKTAKGEDIEGGEKLDNKVITALTEMKGNATFVDEVHQGGFKNPKNAAHALTKKVVDKSKYSFGMTATPVPNAAEDLFHLTDLFAPGTIGDLATWQGRLAQNHFDPETGKIVFHSPDDLRDLAARVAPRLLTGTFETPAIKEQMAKMLPPEPVNNKDDPDVVIPLDIRKGTEEGAMSQHDYITKAAPLIASQRAEQLERERIERGEGPYKEGGKELVTMLLTAMVVRQCGISPSLVDPKYTGPHPKIEATAKVIHKHFMKDGWGTVKEKHPKTGKETASTKGVVVFSNFNKSFHLLKKELAEKYGIDPSLIGEIHSKSEASRAATQDAFNQGKLKIILVGTQAGGAGLNLQSNANHVIHIDSPFTASAKEQAMGRVYRTGQKHRTLVSNMTVQGSYDDRLIELIRNKGALGAILTADDFDTMLASFNGKNSILGGEPPKEASPEEIAKFQEMADNVQISDEDLENLNFEREPPLPKGSPKPPPHVYKVNKKAAAKLPKPLQEAFNMDEFEDEHGKKVLKDTAASNIDQFKQVVTMYKGRGNTDRASHYEGLIEKHKGYMAGVFGKGEGKKKARDDDDEEKDGTTTSPVSGFDVEALSHKSKLPEVKKGKHPYGHDKLHNPKVDKQMGADKDLILTGKDLKGLYSEYHKHKPKTVKEFKEKILDGFDITEQQKLTLVKQAMAHFKNDGLLE